MYGIIYPKNWQALTQEYKIYKEAQANITDFELLYILKNFFQLLAKKVKSRIGLAFSGGIDSSVLAVLMMEAGIDFLAITMCISDQHADSQHAEIFKKSFKIEHQLEVPSKFEIAEAQDFMGGQDAVDFLLLNAFKKRNISASIHGDGIDELLGGYAHHQYCLHASRLKSFENSWAKLTPEHLMPLNRAAQMAESQVILPFLNPKLVELITTIEVNQRASDQQRKIPLKKIARTLKIPDEIINRPKWGLNNALSEKRGA